MEHAISTATANYRLQACEVRFLHADGAYRVGRTGRLRNLLIILVLLFILHFFFVFRLKYGTFVVNKVELLGIQAGVVAYGMKKVAQ